MITNNTDLIQCCYLSVQDTELDSQIDTQLPPELIGTIFSKLASNDIASCIISPYWKAISVGVAKREEVQNLNTFIHFILDNLDEKNAETKSKILGLISEIKLSDDSVVDLLQIKETLLESKEKLIVLLKELGKDKLTTLKNLAEHETKPLFFNDIFEKATPVAPIEGFVHAIALAHIILDIDDVILMPPHWLAIPPDIDILMPNLEPLVAPENRQEAFRRIAMLLANVNLNEIAIIDDALDVD
jgi:hypothetical protein